MNELKLAIIIKRFRLLSSSLIVNSQRLVMAPWPSTPRSAHAATVVRLRPSLRMMPPSQSI